jgi:hypothetical protein
MSAGSSLFIVRIQHREADLGAALKWNSPTAIASGSDNRWQANDTSRSSNDEERSRRCLPRASGGTMYRLVQLLLGLTSAITPYAAAMQATADTLPERVVAQAYEAFNRADAAAFFSFFAPTWYHSVMEDTVAAPSRRIREDSKRDLEHLWARGGTKPKIKVVRRIVQGPYIVDEQVREPGGTMHLDIFEIRNGTIVHEWESGPLGKAR